MEKCNKNLYTSMLINLSTVSELLYTGKCPRRLKSMGIAVNNQISIMYCAYPKRGERCNPFTTTFVRIFFFLVKLSQTFESLLPSAMAQNVNTSVSSHILC